MTGNPRCLRPEEREHIDTRGENGLVPSVRQRRERHVIDRIPAPVRARDAGMDVPTCADSDAKAVVLEEILLLEGPQNRVADFWWGFRNPRSPRLAQRGGRG